MPRKRLVQRSDMEPGTNQQLPAVAPTGMPYGEHQASIQAQQAMPVGTGDPVDPMGAIAQLPPMDWDSVPNINDDTEFPDEPITAGLDPALGTPGAPTAGRVTSALEQVALLSGDSKIRALAEMARAQGV